jgi:hypothetical protein
MPLPFLITSPIIVNMGAGQGKTRRVQGPLLGPPGGNPPPTASLPSVGVQDNYETQRAAFTEKIESACESGDKEALEQVLDEIEQASKANLQRLEKSATADHVFDAKLAWASLANDAVQRFYMGG